MPERARLTKTLFVAGVQCHRKLWWQVHEPTAVELQPDIVLQDLFDQGTHVGALARTRYAGGVLLDRGRSRDERVADTARALEAGATVLFEPAFEADGVHVAADVLRRDDQGWRLTEVKSSSSVKPEHVADAAIQAHVLSRNGLEPSTVEILHLNPGFTHPDGGDLFAATDVTAEVRARRTTVPGEVAAQLAVVAGPLPDVAPGLHCHEPRQCPFHDRCWPADANHIRHLYLVGPKKTVAYMQRGIHRIDDLPPDEKLPDAARRQRRALAGGTVVVERTLSHALAPFAVAPLGFLDFETIARAVPVWDGMSPWTMAAAQFSYHEVSADGLRHEEFLAEGPLDARPVIARRLVEATRNARAVVTYSAFEKTRIRDLQAVVPELAPDLRALEAKLVDLLPVIRNNVYHPGFRGSFSIKHVLEPLVPDLSYTDLVIVNGMVASVEIARLLFVADRIPAHERDRVRADLLAYCQRDTEAMLRLLHALRGLASGAS